MSAPLSMPELVMQALRARLAAMPSDGYALPPQSVARVDDFSLAALRPRSEYTTQYLLRAGEDRVLGRSTQTFDRELEVWCLCASWLTAPARTNPHGTTPALEQAQNAMARDAEVWLLADPTLGGLLYDLELPAVGRDFEVDMPSGLAVIEVRVVCRYRYRRGTA